MSAPTVCEIVAGWLSDHGWDGLRGDGCGCAGSYLMACGCPSRNCAPAVRVRCTGCANRAGCEEYEGCDLYMAGACPGFEEER